MSPNDFTGGPVSAYGPPDPAPPGPLPYADIATPQSQVGAESLLLRLCGPSRSDSDDHLTEAYSLD